MATTDSIRTLAVPLLAALGLDLWDVESAPGTVRVLVDRDGGVDLDALAQASRAVSDLLDAHDELTPGAGYQLEVSSPGIERTLRTLDQHRAYVGATVTVKTAEAVLGARRHRGVIAGVDAGAVLLVPEGDAQGTPVTIPFDLIQRTRTVADWGTAPVPPGSKATRPAAAPKAEPVDAGATGRDPAETDKDRSR